MFSTFKGQPYPRWLLTGKFETGRLDSFPNPALASVSKESVVMAVLSFTRNELAFYAPTL